MSFLTHLRCYECQRNYDCSKVQTFCLNCQAPLFPQYDLDTASGNLDRDAFRARSPGMWRWHEMLPVHEVENRLSLGEGDAPLLGLSNLGGKLGLDCLYAKDESLNPTGTFKARGLSCAVAKAKELGVKKVIIPTAGNAGGAMAAYAARGCMEAFIYMPKDTPEANIIECRIAGAIVQLVDGLISDAARLAKIKAETEGWFDLSTFKEPYRVEGKKIMGYELAESFHWRLPEVIIYPTGGGTGLVGMWKAFKEMAAMGWLEDDALPRLVAVQSAGCSPVVEAFQKGRTCCDFWEEAETIASGLRVPKSFADKVILDYLRESKGTAVAVRDDEIMEAQGMLARSEGMFSAPEGAATLAALHKLIAKGWVHKDEQIVLFITGTGLKYLDQAPEGISL